LGAVAVRRGVGAGLVWSHVAGQVVGSSDPEGPGRGVRLESGAVRPSRRCRTSRLVDRQYSGPGRGEIPVTRCRPPHLARLAMAFCRRRRRTGQRLRRHGEDALVVAPVSARRVADRPVVIVPRVLGVRCRHGTRGHVSASFAKLVVAASVDPAKGGMNIRFHATDPTALARRRGFPPPERCCRAVSLDGPRERESVDISLESTVNHHTPERRSRRDPAGCTAEAPRHHRSQEGFDRGQCRCMHRSVDGRRGSSCLTAGRPPCAAVTTVGRCPPAYELHPVQQAVHRPVTRWRVAGSARRGSSCRPSRRSTGRRGLREFMSGNSALLGLPDIISGDRAGERAERPFESDRRPRPSTPRSPPAVLVLAGGTTLVDLINSRPDPSTLADTTICRCAASTRALRPAFGALERISDIAAHPGVVTR